MLVARIHSQMQRMISIFVSLSVCLSVDCRYQILTMWHKYCMSILMLMKLNAMVMLNNVNSTLTVITRVVTVCAHYCSSCQ